MRSLALSLPAVLLPAVLLAALPHAAMAQANPAAQAGTAPDLPLDCRPKAEAEQALRAAGQVPLLEAKRADASASRVVLSADPGLTRGYVLEVTAEQVCVKVPFSSIRLNGRQGLAIPAWAPLKSLRQQYNGLLVEETLRTSGRVVFGAVVRSVSGKPASRLVGIAGGSGSFLLAAGYADGTYETIASRPAMEFNANFAVLATRFAGEGASDLERQTGPSPQPQRHVAVLERACLLGDASLCGDLAMLYNGRPAKGNDPGFIRDVARGFIMARAGCALNEARSCLQMGLAHMTGQGAARNRPAAIAAFRKALSLDPDRDKPVSFVASTARGAIRELGATP